MIIRSLKLINYRRFRILDLDFPEDVIGIIGANGVGKTTIIEAIGWALYGSRIVRTDKFDIRSQDVDGKEECATELSFRCGGHDYVIQRRLKGKNAVSEVAMYRSNNPRPVATREQGVNAYVEKIVGLDYRSFFASVFARQKDLAALSTMRPEERRRSINRLINIDSIDEARERVRKDRNDKKQFIAGLTASLKDEQRLKEAVARFKTEAKKTAAQITMQSAELSSAQRQYQDAKKSLDTLMEQRDADLHLGAKLEKIAARLSDLNSRRDRLQKDLKMMDDAEKELKILTPKAEQFFEVKSKKDQYDQASLRFAKSETIRGELERVRTQLTSEKKMLLKLGKDAASASKLKKKMEDAERTLHDAEKKLAAAEKRNQEQRALIMATKRQGEELAEKRKRVEMLGAEGPCPICTRPLHEHYNEVLRQFDKQLASLRELYTTHKNAGAAQLAESERQKQKIEALRGDREVAMLAHQTALEIGKQLESGEVRLSDLGATESKLIEELEEIGEIEYDQTKHAQLKEQFEELNCARERVSRLEERCARRTAVEEEIAGIHTDMQEYETNLIEIKEERKRLAFDEDAYRALKAQVEALRVSYESLRDKVAELRRQKTAVDKDVERMRDELKEQKATRKEISALTSDITYLEALDAHFGQFRLELSGRIRPLIAMRASELLHFTTEGRYSVLELDVDYNISIYEGAVAYPIARFSGGEQDLANLCLRVAISQVVAERSGGSPINFIVLDEIFGSQDEKRRELILNALFQLSSQFRQIFIITHIEEVKDVLPQMIHVVEKDEMQSSAGFV